RLRPEGNHPGHSCSVHADHPPAPEERRRGTRAGTAEGDRRVEGDREELPVGETPMRISHKLSVLCAAALLVGAVACSKQEGQGPAEEAGKKIDDAMRDSAKKLDDAGQKMGEAMQKAGEAMGKAAEKTGQAMEDAAKKADDDDKDDDDAHH